MHRCVRGWAASFGYASIQDHVCSISEKTFADDDAQRIATA
jgi:hypothetical protein